MNSSFITSRPGCYNVNRKGSEKLVSIFPAVLNSGDHSSPIVPTLAVPVLTCPTQSSLPRTFIPLIFAPIIALVNCTVLQALCEMTTMSLKFLQ